MKKTFKLIGIIALAVVTVLGIIACGEPGGGNGGGGGCSHSYGNWTTKSEANCTTAKIEKRICSDCNNEDTNPVGYSLGHDHFESLTCKRTGCDHQYELGDTGPAGGIIFYKDTNGFKLYQGTNNNVASDTYITAYYLEAWTENEESSRWSWANEPNTSRTYTNVPLVQQSHNELNPTQWIGYGLRNTRLIVAAMSGNSIETNRAAQVCYAKTVTVGSDTYNDWFLPSIDELIKMLCILRESEILREQNLTMVFFWSSSQLSNGARCLLFDDYYHFDQLVQKHNISNVFVRSVRAF